MLILAAVYMNRIGTFKIFVKQNIDISLTIQYHSNIFNDTSCLPVT